jgi:hypothetical protein
VHEGEGGDDPLVVEVDEEPVHLRGRQHPLVDDGPPGERGQVDADHVVLDALAEREQPPLEVDPRHLVGTGHEDLLEARHGPEGGGPERRGVDGQRTPGAEAETLLRRDPGDGRTATGRIRSLGGEEDDARAVRAGPRELDVDHGPVEQIGDLDQDAGAVARVGLGPRRPPVLHVAEAGQAHLDHLMAPTAVHVHDEGDTTGVVLEAGLIQPTIGGGEGHGVLPGWQSVPRDLHKHRQWEATPRRQGTTLALVQRADPTRSRGRVAILFPQGAPRGTLRPR